MSITLVTFAFFFGLLISRIGLPPMVGFLAAGFVYNMAGFEILLLQNVTEPSGKFTIRGFAKMPENSTIDE